MLPVAVYEKTRRATCSKEMSSSLLLQRILTAKETTSFVLIEDTLYQSGYVLLQRFATRKDAVVVCLETLPRRYDTKVLDLYGQRVTPRELEQNILTAIAGLQGKKTIIIDSLNLLFLSDAASTLIFIKKLLRSLAPSESTLVLLHHLDVFYAQSSSSPDILSSLRREASTTIRVENADYLVKKRKAESKGIILDDAAETGFISSQSNRIDAIVCKVTHLKRSGKVAMETNILQADKVTSLDSIPGLVKDAPIEQPARSETGTDPAANLPFNLSLTDDQRQAKNQVVLPYLKTEEHPGGTIFYEPDSGDDYDDEDPDEDLDI